MFFYRDLFYLMMVDVLETIYRCHTVYRRSQGIKRYITSYIGTSISVVYVYRKEYNDI